MSDTTNTKIESIITIWSRLGCTAKQMMLYLTDLGISAHDAEDLVELASARMEREARTGKF